MPRYAAPIRSLPGSTVTATYAGVVASSTASSSLSLSIAIGTASSDRYVVLEIGSRSSIYPTAVTVGGIACTMLAGPGAQLGTSTIWISNEPVPTGTTATVALTMSGTSDYTRVTAHAVTGLGSNVPVATALVEVSGSASFTIPAGGTAILAVQNQTGVATPATGETPTFTNDFNVAGASAPAGLGTRVKHLNTSTEQAVTVTPTTSSGVLTLVGAVFHPNN